MNEAESPDVTKTLNMFNLQIPEGFQERVNRLRKELCEISREAQLIIDNTGAYLVVEGCGIDLVGPESSEGTPQENDTLLPYALDVMTAPEETHDLTEAILDHDMAGLLSVATDPANSSGQRVNAYRKLGDYIRISQEGRTAVSIKRELQGHSHQNGPRTYQIAQRIRSLTQAVGMSQPRNLRLVTPDWIYKLPKQEHERL
ncbi:10346_t:CDS:1, partial [Diversispora eburnea]